MFDIDQCFTAVLSTGVLEQTVGASGSEASTNTLRLGNTTSHPGHGGKRWLCARVTEVFNTLTSLDVALQGHEDASFSTGTVTIMTKNLLLAKLAAGALILNQAIPATEVEEYVRLYFTVNGSNPTTGKIIAWIQDHPEPDDETVTG